jgi:hypothetical protein
VKKESVSGSHDRIEELDEMASRLRRAESARADAESNASSRSAALADAVAAAEKVRCENGRVVRLLGVILVVAVEYVGGSGRLWW